MSGSGHVFKHNKVVAKHIEKCIKGGVTVKDMMASMQHLQEAPSTATTLYKVYGNYIAGIRAELVGAVGAKVIEQAMDGDFKSQEFYLKSKGGWSPSNTINNTDQEVDPDEDEGAIDLLMAKLGKVRKENDREY